MKLNNFIQKKLISINLWHLIWMSVVCSEFFTAIMSFILKGKITYDYLVTGSVVSLIVAALVILLIQHTRKIDKRAKEALKIAKTELEKRVQQRTAELETSNAQLNREIEKRKKAQTEAEAANFAKSEFLANMSHELRTPMNHVIGFTELVLNKNFGELNDIQTEYLTDVYQSSNHLLSLINDILDLSKVEAGKLELQPSSVNLRDLLENSLTMFKEKAMKHGIKLINNMNGTPDTITADERKIKQIMYNLLSNAVKFTPDGGEISIASQTCELNNAQFTDTANDQLPGIKISVLDTGIGLIPEDFDRIFNPFEQVEHSKNRKFQGTGLGLSLTKTLVELHGGRIWIESEGIDRGSTFNFVIPTTPESIPSDSGAENTPDK
jgi:signal transduction histidine kinase